MSELTYVVDQLESYMHQAYLADDEHYADIMHRAITLLHCQDEDLTAYERLNDDKFPIAIDISEL